MWNWIKYLIQIKSNTFSFKNPQEFDESGTTALHKAAANGHLEVLKLLVEQGSDVNKTDITGCSPLHAASRNGHMSCVKFLVEHGADFKLKSLKGNTPMIVAKANSQQKVAEYLSTCGKFNIHKGRSRVGSVSSRLDFIHTRGKVVKSRFKYSYFHWEVNLKMYCKSSRWCKTFKSLI